MRFATLASGSKGNATLVEHGDSLLLIDCGISFRKLVQRMQHLGVAPADLTAVLVTHAHTDHVTGLNTLVKQTNLKPYMSLGTARKLALPEDDVHRIQADTEFGIGDFTITPYTIPHDIIEPLGFICTTASASFAVATDIGHANAYLIDVLQNCNAILLESNYDEQMLDDNIKYPPPTKARIRSAQGHLSNEQAGSLLLEIVHRGLGTVIAAHLSENNNTPEIAIQAFEVVLEQTDFAPVVAAAPQHSCSSWYEVTAS